METKGYNGWENKPTWLVNVWLDEYRLAETARKLVRSKQGAEEKETALKGLLEKHNFIVDLSGFKGDLLGWAYAQINWTELANHYSMEE